MSIRRLLALFFCALLALGSSAPSQADCSPHTVAPAQIPRAAWLTLDHVKREGQPPPNQVGGRRFGNYGRGGEQKLPVRGAQGRRIDYQEWDIHPRLPGRNRGPERLVTGSDGRTWYSADHYCSFTEMRR
jgi:guanyl-specific ribonuclease Sa